MRIGFGLARRSAHLLVFAVLVLVTLGIVMLVSTSVFGADAPNGEDVYAELKRQLVWLGIGVLCCGIFAFMNYEVLQRLCWPALTTGVLLLAACYVPSLGQMINGERRWISGAAAGIPLSLQPSEFAKITLVIALAAWYGASRRNPAKFKEGFLIPGLMAALVILLVAFEMDLGTSLVMGGTTFTLMFLAGTNWKHLTAGLGAALASLVVLVVLVPKKFVRILAFLDPDAYDRSIGLQQEMAKLAFASGQVEGLGLGNSRLKNWMPFPGSDFVFPTVGEELGLVMTLTVVACFAGLVIFGLIIALNAPDRFGFLLGAGIVLNLGLQSALNMGVTTGILPNTGLPLPYVSHGGSHLVCALIGVGILLNIYRRGAALTIRNEPLLTSPRQVTTGV